MADGFIEISNSAQVTGSNFEKITSGIGLFGKAASESITQNKSLSKTLVEMGASAESASAMMTVATLGVSIAIGASIAALTTLADKNEKYIKSLNDNIKKSTETIETTKNEAESLKSLQSQLIEAQGNKEKLWAISNDLNNVIGETPGLLNGESDAWTIANQKIKDRISLLEREIELETAAKVEAQKELFANKHLKKTFLGADFLAPDENGEFMRYLADLVQGFVDDGMVLEDAYKKAAVLIRSMGSSLNVSLDEFKEYLNDNTALAQEILSGVVNNADSGIVGKGFLNQFIEKTVYAGKELPQIETELKAFVEDIKNVNSIIDEYYATVQKGEDGDSLLLQVQESFSGLAEKYSFASDLIIEKSNSVAKQISNAFNDASDASTDSMETLTSNVKSLAEQLKSTTSIMSLLGAAEKEMSETGQISGSMLERLAESGLDYEQYLDASTGKLILNTEALRNKVNADLAEQIALAENTIATNENTIAKNEARIAAINRQAKTEGLTDAMVKENKELLSQNKSLLESNKLQKENIKNLTLVGIAVNNTTKEYKDLNDEMSNLETNVGHLQKAREELITDGELSSKSLENILTLYPEMAGLIGDVSALETALASKQEQLNRERADNFARMITGQSKNVDDFHNGYLSNSNSLVNDLNNTYTTDLQNFETVTQAKIKSTEAATKSIASMWASAFTGAYNGADIATAIAGSFSGAMGTSGNAVIDAAVRESAARHNVEPNLILAIMRAESNFKPTVVSGAGAMGLMQLMPSNVEEYGVKDPFNIQENIEAGTKHIKEFLEKYNGDLKLALAAYNAGPGNVSKYGGVPPFKETEDYIPKVIAYKAEFDANSISSIGNVVSNNLAEFIWPTTSGNTRISSGFVNRTNPISGKNENHSGIDIPAPKGTPVIASKAGVVTTSAYVNGYGYTVIIDHGGGISTLYGHNSELLVSAGQRVSQGQTIALVGSTGYSTGNHIHFEIRQGSTKLNPSNYVTPNSALGSSQVIPSSSGAIGSQPNIDASQLSDLYFNTVQKESNKALLEIQQKQHENALKDRLDALRKEEEEIDLLRREGLISEEEHLNRKKAANEKYLKDVAGLESEYRKRAIDISDDFVKLREQQLEYELSLAEDTKNYDRQIEIHKEYLETYHAQANKYRERGYKETDVEIQELQKKWRAHAKELLNVYKESFENQRYELDKQFSKLEFKISITSDEDAATHEKLLNDQLDNRLSYAKLLIGQMMELQLTTDDNVRSSEDFKETLDDMTSSYEDNVKVIYDLVKAQRSLAESQISAVRDLNNKIIEMLKQRYQDEYDLAEKNNKAKQDALRKEKDLLKENNDTAIKNLDNELKAWQKLWDEEDKRKKEKERDEAVGEISDIQNQINQLLIAANTGDVEAISRIEDLQKQLKEKQKKLDEQDENDQRQLIRNDISDRKEALREIYDLDNESLDNKLKLLEEELAAEKELFDERTKNNALQAEALKLQADGLTEHTIELLHKFEDEFGEGMGILGEYVHNELTKQIEDWSVALSNLTKNVAILGGDSDLAASLNLENLSALTQEQKSVIEQMRANSEAWAKAATEAEKLRLEKLNETLGYGAGFTKDPKEGVWYLDEGMTQGIYDALDSIKSAQTKNIDDIIAKYKEDYEQYNESNESKTKSTEKFKNDTKSLYGTLYDFLHKSLSNYTSTFIDSNNNMLSSVMSLIAAIESATSNLNTLLNAAGNIADIESGVSNMISKTIDDVEKSSGLEVINFNDGSKLETMVELLSKLSKVNPLLFEDPSKPIDMEKLAISATNMNFEAQNQLAINDTYKAATETLNNLPVIKSTGDTYFNINVGSVTKDTLPDFKKEVTKIIKEVAPAIVANDRMRGANAQGYMPTR